MNTAKDRIKQVIKDKFYGKPEALLRFAGVPVKDLRDFMNGKRDFTAEQYERIAAEAGVSLPWLLSGEVDRKVPERGAEASPSGAAAENRNRKPVKSGTSSVAGEGESAPKPSRRGRPRKQVVPDDNRIPFLQGWEYVKDVSGHGGTFPKAVGLTLAAGVWLNL